MDIASTLRIFAHELRLPTSVIQGYARMLRDGALSDADRDRALAQIMNATGRLADLAKDASLVSQWLTAPPTANGGDAGMAALIAQAVTGAKLEVAPAVRVSPDAAGARVTTSNVQALTTALVKILEATAREDPHAPLSVEVRGAGAGACDVIVSPQSTVSLLDGSLPNGPGAEPVPLVRGGLGLTLLLAAAVLEAHHATMWTQSGSRGMIVRLPTQGVQSS